MPVTEGAAIQFDGVELPMANPIKELVDGLDILVEAV